MRNLIKLSILLAVFAIAINSCKKKDKEKTLVSIEVTTQPTKKTYNVGDTFDAAGMVVTAKFSDGSSETITITSGTVTFNSSAAGTNLSATITFEYKGVTKTATVTGITVNAAEPPPPPPPVPTIEVSAVGLDDLEVGVAVSDARIVYTLSNGEYVMSINPDDFNASNLPLGLYIPSVQRLSATIMYANILGTPTESVTAKVVTLPANIPAANVTGATSDVPITISGSSITLSVAKGDGAAVSGAPTLKTVTASSIVVNAVTVATGSQSVEYAISEETTAPTGAGDWVVDKTLFDGLDPETDYYVFARSKANDNYNAGTAQQSAAIKTAEPEPDNVVVAKFRFTDGDWYNPNETPNGNVSIGENTITTTTAGINLSNVFTQGGGTFNKSDYFGEWAYLYGENGKIGVIFAFGGILSSSDMKGILFLGQSLCSDWVSTFDTQYGVSVDISDMIDTHNGLGEFYE